MEEKKSAEANLEKSRTPFIVLGLAFSVALFWVAAEYKTYGKEIMKLGSMEVEEEEPELPPITMATPPPPPPPPPPPVAPPQLEVVDNEVEVEEEVVIEEVDEDLDLEDLDVPDIEEELEPIDFVRVEQKPIFPGCEDEPKDKQSDCFSRMVNTHVVNNFELHPVAREQGIYGRVFVQFTVGTDGKVSNVIVLKGRHKLLDEAAIKAVESLPKMTPGKQTGRAIPVNFVVPVNIKNQG